ncbi:hypothetical protein [uncultured Deinococcus sp.]|uniref:hypothetical protein n=1 Tax=uncultured Deinococcus sp. TaxID=158789 RepID=UPI0037479450
MLTLRKMAGILGQAFFIFAITIIWFVTIMNIQSVIFNRDQLLSVGLVVCWTIAVLLFMSGIALSIFTAQGKSEILSGLLVYMPLKYAKTYTLSGIGFIALVIVVKLIF